MPHHEPTLRNALVAAMLPSPGPELPAASALDLSTFWPKFDAAAPLHLRLAFRTATLVIAGALPFMLGYRRTLPALNEDDRDAVLRRGLQMAAVAPLFDIVKVVVAFAYFDQPIVARAIRGRA